ncbi:FadR/GntR family transcriptional regulator [uncultured Xylophilus sp.]|uniref:FadR/GntR family transcriptional regulator n=1 Tax=uncultured Xylophilus sp. TaxID=296832 RepID=UPI0025FA885D|nr:FadR/GntR family transcriptional regulator [uncultured Xylophilus sp.]
MAAPDTLTTPCTGRRDDVSGLGLEPVRHERFAERVYDGLFHSIVTGKLGPGTRLPPELQLAATFGVSRPVVRQALDRLRNEQLVESIRGSGTYVCQGGTPAAPMAAPTPTAADMSHIFHGLELRMLVEPESAALAALRRKPRDLERMAELLDGFDTASRRGDIAHHLDYGFHEAIAQATGNPRIGQVLKSLEYDVSRAVNLGRRIAQLKPWHRTQDTLDEHRTILEAIRTQDPDTARRAMRGHIENARIRILEGDPKI